MELLEAVLVDLIEYMQNEGVETTRAYTVADNILNKLRKEIVN